MNPTDKKEPSKTVTYEELSLSNMWQIEALYRLLVKKGIVTEQELDTEYKLLKKEYDREIR